ncbi:piggyBac transposable element-derived protein 4-like [Vespa velutina]|uniref:piggyBac transposable element-derived protein 4-like n=1 Tax=Vespa velutina TaxID=202808 RepID=UPI001FB36976|nr:piggyBac transposable element-derived protein 4-like [Vespa velutina]
MHNNGSSKKPKIQMNWSKRAIIETPIFRKSIPLKRFLQITKFLHFANNEETDNRDKLRKVRPVINYLNEKFKEVYVMEENITIDESLMKFKGCMSCKQFNLSKRARFRIQFYKLCELASGYCYNFKKYTGNDKINHDYSASETVIMELLRSIPNKGHILYVDNWYSSSKLFFTLVKNGINVLGTVRCNRKNMSRDFVKAKLKKGEYIIRSCNGILALRWKDKRDVYIISTKHESAEMIAQNQSHLSPTFKPSKYRLRIAEGLLQTVPSQDYNRRGPLSNGNIPMRLQAQLLGLLSETYKSHAIEKKPNESLQSMFET